ncbi:MAG: type II secretion system ATPase GspE [Myxococcota bacterium]|nr:type II secretion system ATPase GspE [Myxococcota bacterium]
MGIRRTQFPHSSAQPHLDAVQDTAENLNVDLEDIEASYIRPLSLTLVRDQLALPLWMKDGVLEVAIGGPQSLLLVDEYAMMFGCPVKTIKMSEKELVPLINQAFDKATQSALDVMEEMAQDGEIEMDGEILVGEDLLDNPDAAPMVRFVNSLLSQAIKQKASDIHIEPFEKDMSVRLRIDGVLQEDVQPPKGWKEQLVSRIKIMSNLDIAKKNIPQDGRIRTRMAGREIDIRVSTLPVRHGERVVMRILEKKAEFSLDGVGMSPDTLAEFREFIGRPYGIILVCGPTGSGKTTTLYSALSEINAPDLNILTIEDPIEYELRGIGQTQVNHKIGLSFARVIRAHLRQDPDVILVGETRDKETAENAIQASLTGHLVFSTIHTNDAPTAFTRLVDMGIEPFLVATSLVAVLAQRLVRRLCPHCKEEYHPTVEELAKAGREELLMLGVTPETFRGTLYRPKGCPECGNKGFSGRMGIYEFMEVSENIRSAVTAGKDAAIIKKICVENGMRTLRGDGLKKVLEGQTSLDEIYRVTAEGME